MILEAHRRLDGTGWHPFASCNEPGCHWQHESTDLYRTERAALSAAGRAADRHQERHEHERAVEADPFHGLA